jgi:ABC-type hemin transport system substrate-binding protein
MVAGGDTYIGGMLEALGFANAFGGRDRYPRVSVEELVAAKPDVVLLPSEPYEFDEDDAAELSGLMGDLGGVGAAAGALSGPSVSAPLPAPRLVLCSGEDLMWYGSRTPEALRRLRQVLA